MQWLQFSLEIFPSFPLSYPLLMFILTIMVIWCIVLGKRLDPWPLLYLAEEVLHLGLWSWPLITIPLPWNINLTCIPSQAFTCPRMFKRPRTRPMAQYPFLGPLPLYTHTHTQTHIWLHVCHWICFYILIFFVPIVAKSIWGRMSSNT